MYGKLENGKLIYAPKSVIVGEKRIINPNEEMLLSLGYLHIENTEAPATETGYHVVGSWKQIETKIVRVWAVEEDKQTDPTTEERLSAIESAILELIIGGETGG